MMGGAQYYTQTRTFPKSATTKQHRLPVMAGTITDSTSRKHTYIILTPFKPHFYIVKLGLTEVYIIFFFCSKHRVLILVRTEAVLTSTHNLCFKQKYENNVYPFIRIFFFI